MNEVEKTNVFISKLAIAKESDGRTTDSKKYKKSCPHFLCLEDGTITKDYKYCDGSEVCRHTGLRGGKVVPMEGHYLSVFNPQNNEIEWVEYCTGMYDLRPLKERYEDDKAH